MLRKLCLLPAAAVLAFAPPALAATPAIGADRPPTVGAPTLLSTDAPCASSRCDWSVWVPNRYGQLVGAGVLGVGATVVWTPSLAIAARPYVVVALKVTQGGPTNQFSLVQRAFVVVP